MYEPIPECGCWLWTGGTDKDGYGRYSLFNRTENHLRGAHRVSVYLDNRNPIGKVVMHTCDNPSCVNPAHLKVGTIQDNNLDKLKKGRQSKLKGSSNGTSKLTEVQVKQIRQEAVVGNRTGYNNGSNIKEIAIKYNVSIETIRKIIHRHTWKHI